MSNGINNPKVAATDKRATFVCIDDAKVDAALRSAQRAILTLPLFAL